MKRTVYGLIISMILFWLSSVGFAAGIPGATDKVSAATLLVPFFEVGVNSTTHPNDTLLVLWAISGGARIHYHVWDVDGNAVGLYGNMDLADTASWNTSMRGLISSASSAVKTALTDASGNFFRGFVTIDVVTADTTLSPIEIGYPLGTNNRLEGWIYYVRIAEGSSNSMAMIPIEEVGSGVNSYLHGFYSNSDGREEIDVNARACAGALATGGSCVEQGDLHSIRSRIFLDNSTFNASTRIIVFYWKPGTEGGISPWCDTNACDPTATYNRYNESGTLVQQDAAFRLENVVNVIDVAGTENGFVSIRGIAGDNKNWQAYGFSITNAQPTSGASANWDAILESYINP
jgi:hypothetical protein